MIFAADTFHGIEGSEEKLFREILRNMEGVGVEIGCCDGYSSCVILDASKMLLTSIDPIVPDSREITLVGNVDRLIENTKPFRTRWTFVKDYSQNVTGLVNDPLDFLFIDGDHEFENVLKDFQQWTPKLRKGGLLAMHDCRMNRAAGARFHLGPSRVADECVFSRGDQWQIVGEAFSLMIARKL